MLGMGELHHYLYAISFQIPTLGYSSVFQLGRCRSVKEFEKLNRIGEGTYGIVCEWSGQGACSSSCFGSGGLKLHTPNQATACSQTLISGVISTNLHH